MAKKIYLAGPIAGLLYEDSNRWRDEFVELCHFTDWEIASPLRYKQFLKSEGELGQSYDYHPLTTSKGLTTRDRYDVMTCDIVVANMIFEKTISIGTMIEVGWADAWRKPIVMICEHEGVYDSHAMLNHLVGYYVRTVHEAFEVANAILL